MGGGKVSYNSNRFLITFLISVDLENKILLNFDLSPGVNLIFLFMQNILYESMICAKTAPKKKSS